VDFFRFPHTPHLVWLGDKAPRDDKVLAPAGVDELLARQVVVEEKLDGANLGLSIGPDDRLRAQNRGAYLHLPYAGQFARLSEWLGRNEQCVSEALKPGLIVFGEWVAARHSLDYTNLPDWWLVFDVYDRRAQRFWSVQRRNRWARASGLQCVPCLFEGSATLESLKGILVSQRSKYRDGPMEGLVVRADETDWSVARAKLVRPDFAQAIADHWRSRPLRWNRLGSNLLQT
jgi:ATP-dependent RNA circularization protein (DNA/RNA ligase family)